MKPLSASFAIRLGEPFGPEGPIIQTSGALGSLLGKLISVISSERRILVAAGAGASSGLRDISVHSWRKYVNLQMPRSSPAGHAAEMSHMSWCVEQPVL